MAASVIDALDSAESWQALAPDGVTPSTAVALATDTSRRSPLGVPTLRVTASDASHGHLLRHAIASIDLSPFDELRLWSFGGRVADGTPGAPFFFEFRLGSGALPVDAPGNKWNRMVPVSTAGRWDLARLGIGDLAAAVRSAATTIQIRCAAGVQLTCNLSRLLAVRAEMLADVDAALLALLDKKVIVNGQPVTAVLHPANGALGQSRPYIEITHYDVVFSGERTEPAGARTDFTTNGYSLVGGSFAYDLYYEIAAVADERAAQARMLELVLATLRPRGDLLVNGLSLPLDMVVVPPRERIGGMRTDRIPIHYKIATRYEVSTPEAVRPVQVVTVDTDMKS